MTEKNDTLLTSINLNTPTFSAITTSNSNLNYDISNTLEVSGKVKINGEYLDDRLERIETLLHIPTRDFELENEFPKLKKLWEEYNNELEKYKTWKRIQQ